MNVGQIKLTSEATLSTSNTTIETGADVLTHYGKEVAKRVVVTSENLFDWVDPDTGGYQSG